MYRELETKQLEILLKRYQESEKDLKDRGAIATPSPQNHNDMYLTKTKQIRQMIEIELEKRNLLHFSLKVKQRSVKP